MKSSWSGDVIFLGAGEAGIVRLPAQGGAPETVARVEAGEFADAPMLLPDGDHLLFTIASGTSPDRWDKARIVVESLRSHERKTVIEGGSDGRYLASGHLTYAVAGHLYAVPFSIERLTTIGNPVPVIEGVARAASPGTSSGYAPLAVSNTGTLAYVPGPTELTGRQSAVGPFAREGRMDLLKLPRGPWEQQIM